MPLLPKGFVLQCAKLSSNRMQLFSYRSLVLAFSYFSQGACRLLVSLLPSSNGGFC